MSILKSGLQVFNQCVVHSSGCAPYLCFGTSPKAAWCLSGNTLNGEIDEWDLWQVELAQNDSVRVLCHWGPDLSEIRTDNSIPADRLWLVGMREPAVFTKSPDSLEPERITV